MPTSFPTQEIKKPTLFLIKVTKPINFIAWHCRILFSTYLYITAQMSKKSRKISKIFKKIIEKLQKSPILYIFCYFFSGRTLCRSTTRHFSPIGRHGFFLRAFRGFIVLSNKERHGGRVSCLQEKYSKFSQKTFGNKIPGGDFVPIAPPIPHRMFLN